MLTNLMGGELSVESTPGRGSVFRILLFLPQLHGQQALDALPRERRIGYKGIRRRILVVDNEHVDRELLRSVLEPLGFQVEQAGSGHECLAMLPSVRPHLVFMDLAMPGIDGWETLRRMRMSDFADVPAAIISANAFDKGLDNEVGIAPGDFLLKPIRVDDVLDWIGQRLELEWVCSAEPSVGWSDNAVPTRLAQLTWPPAARLRALDEMIELGYLKGILAVLGETEAAHPDCSEFVRVQLDLARQFRFDAMRELLRQAGGAANASAQGDGS
jgi:CheY-like chemotaxis protein